MSTKTLAKPVTAADVRFWFFQHPKMVPAGTEHTVAMSAKGRIAPAAREVFNKRSGKTYTEGTPECEPLSYVKVSASGARLRRVAMLPKAQIRELAGEFAGQRGVLSEAAREAASEAYTALINAAK